MLVSAVCQQITAMVVVAVVVGGSESVKSGNVRSDSVAISRLRAVSARGGSS